MTTRPDAGQTGTISGFLKEVSKDDFLENRLLQVAIERELEVIGEALNRLRHQNEEFFDQIEQAHKIIGTRNILAHGYDVIDYRIIWSTVQEDLLPLRKQLEKLV